MKAFQTLFVRPQLILILLVVVFSEITHAQEWLWQKDDLVLNPSGLDLEHAISWAWGDLTEDGLPDIIVLGYGDEIIPQSRLAAFRALDSQEPPYWYADSVLFQGLTELTSIKGLALADLDGDGHLNIITLTFVHPFQRPLRLIYWRRDAGGAWQPDSTVFQSIVINEASPYSTDPYFADLESDGDLDMIIGTDARFGEIGLRLFENVGTPNLPSWQEDSTRLELVYQNPPGYNAWSPVLMQTNEDDLLDLLVAFDVEGLPGVVVYAGITDSFGWRWSGESKSFFSTFYKGDILKILPFDVTANGRDDLLVLENGTGRAYVTGDSISASAHQSYYRVGPMRFPNKSYILFEPGQNPAKLLLAVGHVITFLGYATAFQPYESDVLAGMKLWRQTGWFKSPDSFFDVIFQFKAQLNDINRNDQPDFTLSADQHFFQAYENPDPSLQGVWMQRNELIAPFDNRYLNLDTLYFDQSFADLDGDGDDDLLLVERVFPRTDSSRSRYRFFENDLRQEAVRWIARPNWLAGLDTDVFFLSVFSDLDLDGDYDLTFGTKEGQLVYFENVGDADVPSWQLIPDVFENIDVSSNAAPSFADFDDDGRPDLFVGNRTGELFYFHNASVVSVEERSDQEPYSFGLLQNYPNPFNPATTIRYEISEASLVQLTIYNIRGQIVRKLVEQKQSVGSYNIVWDGKADAGFPAASGIYVYELRVRKQLIERKKMVLIH